MMNLHRASSWQTMAVVCASLALLGCTLPAGESAARNVAPLAVVTASSERSEAYAARFAIDGQVPAAHGREDAGQAWAAGKNAGQASLVFVWQEPTQVATLVYYARTAWGLAGGWKDYEIRIDDASEPVTRGAFRRGHGPQRVDLPTPVAARRLELKFLNRQGEGGSPGASEVQIFTAPPAATALHGSFTAQENVALSAAVTASSEFNAGYAAAFASDGRFPVAGGQDDVKQAWVAAAGSDPVTLSFVWKEPTTISSLVYYGRSAWSVDMCWKDYEICIDDQTAPAAKGAFRCGRGPQQVDLPAPIVARKLVLRLLSDHAQSGSPGADEVQIFAERPAPSQLTGVFTTLAQEIRHAYFPSRRLVRFVVPSLPEGATAWRAVVSSEGDAATLAEGEGRLPLPISGGSLLVPDLPEGRYRLRLTFTGGAEPVHGEVAFECRRFAWEGLKLGMEEVVVPPFEPLSVDAANASVDCVQRRYTHGAAGLWKQVVSQGSALLAGPVRLEATSGGRTVVADGAAASFTAVRATQVAGTASWKAGSLSGSTAFAYDYDGLMRVTLRLAPGDAEIERLQLVVPLKESEAWLMHPVTVELRQHFAGRIPSGEGKVWDSAKVPNKLAGWFVPYLYVGGPERGICFAADNDRDWISASDAPAMEIDRAGGTLNLRLNLIARPARLARERTISFVLQATPAKPMAEAPRNWRRWSMTRTADDVDDVQISFWGGNQYWGGRHFAVSYYPALMDFGFWEQLGRHRTTGKVDPGYLEAFLGRLAGASAEELANLRAHYKEGLRLASAAPFSSADTRKPTLVIPFINPRGCSTENRAFATSYLDEWQRVDIADPQWDKAGRVMRDRGGSVWYDIEPVGSFVDMALYHHRKMYQTFADGIYWDDFFLKPCYTPGEAGGPAYVDDEGRLRPGVNLMAFRELVRRNAVMMHGMGKRPLSFIHMTNANIVPMLSFATMNLDWEWRDQGGNVRKDLQDRLGVDRETGLILAQSLGLQTGCIMVAANRFETAGAEMQPWLLRTAMAVCLPHEMKIHHGDKAVAFVLGELARFGYGQDGCRVLRYWEPGFPLKTEGARMHALVLSRGPKALVAIGNYGAGTLDAEVAVADASAPTLAEYDPAQLQGAPAGGPGAGPQSGGSDVYTVTLHLDLAALGLAQSVRAVDLELKAKRKKAERNGGRRPDAGTLRPGSIAPEVTPDAGLGLDPGDLGELKRIAPGVFELRIRKHDFALIEIGD